MAPVTIERFLAAVLLVLASLSTASRSGAQDSPYLPVDDPAYAYIDALRARGALGRLSLLERPYTVAEIRRALAQDGGAVSGRVVESWRHAVRAAIARIDPWGDVCLEVCAADSSDGLAIVAGAGVFAEARTSGVRELMLADDAEGSYPGAEAKMAARGGPFVASARVIMDAGLKDDPEFRGKKDRSVAGRVEDAYVGVSLPYLEVTAGRIGRNLGPAALTGLQIGDYSYTYDHLFLRLGTRRFHLSTIVAALDPMILGPDSVAQRYLAVHRLSGRWGGLEIALAEAMVFGGVDRRFDPGYLNPLNVYQLTQYNEQADGNVSYSLEAAWQTRRAGTYAMQVLLDDFQIDDCSPGCEEPSSYGLTLSAEGLPLAGAQRLFASYARVSNLTYRTSAAFERWSMNGVGLGHGFSDYDEARAGLDLALLPGLTLRPYGALRRQGEGDFRLDFPAPAEYSSTPGIHAGIVERTVRAAAEATWSTESWLRVRGDLGWNRVRNHGHLEGAAASGLAGWVRVELEFPWVPRWRLARD